MTNSAEWYIISSVKFCGFTLKTRFCVLFSKAKVDIVAKDLKFSALLDVYGDMLTEKQRDMLDLYYNSDLSLSEIAQDEGISRQGVRDSIKRGEEALLEMDEKIGVMDIVENCNTLMRHVSSHCDEIIGDCKTYTTTKSVIEKLEAIKSSISGASLLTRKNPTRKD